MKIAKLAVAVALATALVFPALSYAGEATDQVKTTIDGVIKVLTNPALKGPAKKEARRDKLREEIKKRFGFEEMAQRSLGKHWKSITPEQKAEFLPIFSRFIENSYIGKIENYTDEKVEYGDEVNEQNSSEVKTRVILKSGTGVPINYRLAKRGGNWMVYDVVIEGVSLVTNYRTQFNNILQSKPFAELIKQLKTKLEQAA